MRRAVHSVEIKMNKEKNSLILTLLKNGRQTENFMVFTYGAERETILRTIDMWYLISIIDEEERIRLREQASDKFNEIHAKKNGVN